jgi:hypothetical protein
MHLRHFSNNANKENCTIHNNIEGLVVGSVACKPGDDSRDQHEELLGAGPRDSTINLLEEGISSKLSLAIFIGRAAFDPV